MENAEDVKTVFGNNVRRFCRSTQSLLSVLEVPAYLLYYDGIPLSESKLPESRIDVVIDEELLSGAGIIKKRIYDMQ